MKFEHTELEHEKRDLQVLTEVMENHGFICAGGWDYERITYDYKFEIVHDVYYLRVQGYAVEGDIGTRHATIQLMTPILGKHYYPHGIEYEGEDFPESLVSKCNEILKKVKTELLELAY